MTARSRDLAVASFAAALLTMAMSFALATERASGLITQPPNEVTILHVEWDRAETSPGVISEGSKSVFPASAFTETSQRASDFFKAASYGVFGGWTTKFAGTFKIAAPRLPSGQGGHSQPCDTRFFEDITSRADAAAQAAGVTLGTAVIYYFDEKLCAQMPDGGAEAAVFNVAKKAVMQVTRTAGPTRHELVHAVGHIMRLQHADSLNCTSGGQRVPFGDQCTVEGSGDPYDSMGEGTGTFSAGALSALGWFRDSQHQVSQAPNDDLRRGFQLGAITDGGIGTSFPTRAVRFSDGGTNFWLEYRARTGIDATEPPFPAQGSIGVVLHKEIRAAFGREPSFQLIDLSPSTPRSDSSLKLPGQSWENPLGRLKVTFSNFATGGATITVGPKPGTAPVRPTSPTALVVQLGWDGEAGGTGAPEDLRPQLELTSASNQASSWFEEVSGGIKSWKTHYAAATIPTPRSEFVGAGLSNRCTEQTFADIDAGAEAALKARGFVPTDYAHIFYVYNGAVCQSMPDPRGIALPGSNRTVVQATGTNFGSEPARSQTLIEAVGHQLGQPHATVLECTSDDELGTRVTFSHTCFNDDHDPYDALGGGAGSFSAPVLDRLGWMRGSDGDEVVRFNAATETIAPLTAAPGRLPEFRNRAVFVPEVGGGLWIEYRQPVGVEAPDRIGSPGNSLGVLLHREFRTQTPNGLVRRFSLLDVTPRTPASDSALAVGRTWTDEINGRSVKVESADPNGAVVTVRQVQPSEVIFPEVLPHPVPPANPDPAKSMLVLNVGWDDPNPNAVVPLDEKKLDQTSYVVNGPLNDWYRQSAPSGLFRNWQAYSGGVFKISSPILPPLKPGEVRCDTDAIWARAERAAEAAGLVPGRFGHVMVSLSRSPCGFAGLAPLGGRRSIVLGGVFRIIAHELGHTTGLLHAQSLRCYEGVGEARHAVTLSPTCDIHEYGDFTDRMGSGEGSFNPVFANQLGWLKNQFISLEAGLYEKTFDLIPYAGQESPIEGPKRAIRLVDGQSTLWMEWREPVGPDAKVRPGLYIRRERLAGTNLFSQLIDMTPETENSEDAPLRVGQTWVNPVGTMEITLKGGGSSGAIVTIKRHGLAQMPDLTGDTIAEIGTELSPLGLQYGGTSALIEDCSGAFINRVIDQSIAPGTLVDAGTSVTARMGVKAKTTCQ